MALRCFTSWCLAPPATEDKCPPSWSVLPRAMVRPYFQIFVPRPPSLYFLLLFLTSSSSFLHLQSEQSLWCCCFCLQPFISLFCFFSILFIVISLLHEISALFVSDKLEFVNICFPPCPPALQPGKYSTQTCSCNVVSLHFLCKSTICMYDSEPPLTSCWICAFNRKTA